MLAWLIFLLMEKFMACIYVKSRDIKDLLKGCVFQEKCNWLYEKDNMRNPPWCFICKQKLSVENHTWKSKCWRWGFQELPGCCWVTACPSPTPASPCQCLLDTACQATPEESRFGASSAEEKKKTEGQQALLFRETSFLLQRLPWKAYGLWFLYGFWHITLIRRRKGNTAMPSNPKHNELAKEDAVKSFQ